jgi:hypothetical protein
MGVGAHALLGLLFIGGAIWSFVTPYGAFWALASVLGILLVVVGTVHIITAISSKVFNDAWWFGVIGGLLEVFIGFWVSAQSFRAQAVFLIIWAWPARAVPRHLRDRAGVRDARRAVAARKSSSRPGTSKPLSYPVPGGRECARPGMTFPA